MAEYIMKNISPKLGEGDIDKPQLSEGKVYKP